MNLNDVLTKQNFISQLLLNSGDKELSRELKVKIMRIRMAYNKLRQQFDNDVQEFTKELVPDELRELSSKENLTEEENERYKELNDKVNSDYQVFLVQKGTESVELNVDDTFTMEEYIDILDINSGNDVEINGNKIKATDFLEIVHDLFVKED